MGSLVISDYLSAICLGVVAGSDLAKTCLFIVPSKILNSQQKVVFHFVQAQNNCRQG